MTTTPRMETVPIRVRIASTAAPSPPFLSPRPTQRPAAIAAASVTRTSSRARLRSGASRCTASSGGTSVTTTSGVRGEDGGTPAHPPRRRSRAGTGDNGTVSTSTDPSAGRTFAGLLRALVPALVILLLIVWWQRGEPAPVPTVDVAADVAYAPSGEQRSPVTLTIGYLTG